jgi:polyisoprenoid-binding protein YceI
MSTTSTAIAERAAVGTTWTIDSDHSGAEFSVKHMMIATVRGAFQHIEGTLHWDGEYFEAASVEARIDASSITTNNQLRDNHLRSGDFFMVEQWPTITFKSANSSVAATGRDQFMISGDLTIRDRTRPVVLAVEYKGQVTDNQRMQRAAFTATASLSRKDFGITWNQRLDGGGVVVGDTVKVVLDIVAVRQG